MLGVLVNVAAVIVGSLIGLLLKRGIPEKIAKAMTTGVSLAVIYIGIDGMLCGEKTLVLILSLVIGGMIGTVLNLDQHLENLGRKIESKFKSNKNGSIAEGFISSTLLFCVGAMTVVGALQSGLSGDHEMQYTKAVLDFISSIVLASTLGFGVILSSVSVLLIQGSITLLARFVAPFLSDAVVAEMTCVGSVLILALALNLLGLTKIKLMNYVPAIFLPLLLCRFL